MDFRADPLSLSVAVLLLLFTYYRSNLIYDIDLSLGPVNRVIIQALPGFSIVRLNFV